MKKILVVTGGGDCPGLNAVIRAIAKKAALEKNWQVVGSLDAYHGILRTPEELIDLDQSTTAGIHVRGGTILGTSTKGDPFNYAVQQPDNTWQMEDRSDFLLEKLDKLNIDAIISIGGDGSQKISQKLFEKGCNIVGVPKTIDNDLSATDFTFGFQTAVQIASDSMDRLVTTAESHHRVLIMEVMGRDAGWIALYTAVSAGAEVCLIPEIPYDINKVVKRLNSRFTNGRGFANIVVAEGAKAIDGQTLSRKSDEIGYQMARLGGIAYRLSHELKEAGCEADIRETVLGHIQRGGTPSAYDRVLATQYGVKAFELVKERKFGTMVSYRKNAITCVSLKEAVESYQFVDKESFLVKTARDVGISFGD